MALSDSRTGRGDCERDGCDEPLSRRGRRFCSPQCYYDALRQERPVREPECVKPWATTAGRYEDLQELLEFGEHVTRIPARLGTTASGLARWLRRYGYHDDARPFDRIAGMEQRRRRK
jgi:hypothetical protein